MLALGAPDTAASSSGGALEVADSAALDVLSGVQRLEASHLALAGAALWVAFKAGQHSASKPTGLGGVVGSFLAFKALNVAWSALLVQPKKDGT